MKDLFRYLPNFPLANHQTFKCYELPTHHRVNCRSTVLARSSLRSPVVPPCKIIPDISSLLEHEVTIKFLTHQLQFRPFLQVPASVLSLIIKLIKNQTDRLLFWKEAIALLAKKICRSQWESSSDRETLTHSPSANSGYLFLGRNSLLVQHYPAADQQLGAPGFAGSIVLYTLGFLLWFILIPWA